MLLKDGTRAAEATQGEADHGFEKFAAWILPFHPATAFVALVGLSFRARRVWEGLREQKADLTLWALLGVAGLISVIGAYDTGRAAVEWFTPFLFLWLYALGRWAIQSPSKFLLAMLRGTAVFALVILIARLLHLEVSVGDFTVLGAFTHPGQRGNVLGIPSNGLAVILEAGIVGGFGLLLLARSMRDRAEAVVIALLCLGATAITLSRGAMVGMTAGAAALGLLLTPRSFFAFALAAAGMLGISSRVRTRFLSIVDLGAHGARIDIWRSTLRMLREHLWFGVGPGNFGRVYPSYSVTEKVARFGSAHNNYLYFTAAWGLVGGLLFFGWQAWVMVRSLVRGLQPYQKIMWAILIAFGTHVLFDDLMAAYAGLLLGCLENPAYSRNKKGDAHQLAVNAT